MVSAKRAVLVLVIVAACGGPEESAPTMLTGPQTFSFTSDPIGAPPAGWRVEGTRNGTGGAGAGLATWAVVAEPGAPSRPQALAVTAAAHGEQETFNLCWTDGVSFGDGKLSVALQAVGGVVDQGGGPMWRVQDRDNYYLCRVNPLESNFRVYRVVNGMRHQLGSVQVEPKSGWRRIEVVLAGKSITCTLDGGAKLAVEDASLPAVGGVGVWTKADALTRFDDLRVEPAH